MEESRDNVSVKVYLYMGIARCIMFGGMGEFQNRKAYNRLLAGVSATRKLEDGG